MMAGAEPSLIDMTAFGSNLGSLQFSMLNKKKVAKEQAVYDEEMVQLQSDLTLKHKKKHHHRHHHKHDHGLKYSSLLFTDDLDGSDVTIYQAEKQSDDAGDDGSSFTSGGAFAEALAE
jgi:hypothetical protein